MGHWIFELSFVDSFHGELDLSRQIFSGKEFCTIRFATKSDDFVSLEFYFKESGRTFSLGREWSDEPVMFFSFKFFTTFGLD